MTTHWQRAARRAALLGGAILLGVAPFLPWVQLQSPDGVFTISISLDDYSKWAVLLTFASAVAGASSLVSGSRVRPLRLALAALYALLAIGMATPVVRESGGGGSGAGVGLGAILAMVGWVLFVSVALARDALPSRARLSSNG